jgi:HPt (histidine-containing phosphotransfer) domain-containing protein
MMNTNFRFIDLSYLDLMSDGDMEMKQTMIEMLLEEIPEEMEKMKVLHQDANWKELREVSHKMKSTLAFVGNHEMTEANKTIEDIAKAEQNLEQLPHLLAQLFDLYPKVLDELKLVAV